MSVFVPDYYKLFRCSAGECMHTCCRGWEIDIDEESLNRFMSHSDISKHIELGETPHFKLKDDDSCPFLNDNGLCNMMLKYGINSVCRICADHPRFRNIWTDMTEIGYGLVCEEACKLILSRNTPLELVPLGEDDSIVLPADEGWLYDVRENLLSGIKETGPKARLLEYLIFRHIPDALYDDRLEERISFIEASFKEITGRWEETDGSLDAISEIAREWSYDVEYDDEELEKRISSFSSMEC